MLLVALIGLAVALRWRGVLRDEHGAIFARLVTDVTLPALIFGALARHRFGLDQLNLMAIMMSAEVVCLALTWILILVWKVPRAQRGVVLVASAFGSSAFLGFAIVTEAFAGDAASITDAVVISELGVGSLIFTLGVVITMHYGGGAARPGDLGRAFLGYLRSPVFVALAAGVGVSVFSVPTDHPVMAVILRFTGVLADANTVLVALTIGTVLQARAIRTAGPLLALVVVMKLVVQPGLAGLASGLHGVAEPGRTVVVLEAAMPTASLVVVFARRYGGDAALAAAAVLVTLILGLGSVLGVVALLG